MNLRVRRSLLELQAEYEQGNKKPLEDLMRAWKGVKELPPEDPRSFFMIGGFHGEPFRGGGWGSSVYWGGYCNHGNVLFPTWHRVYLLKLEDALRSIPGCGDVTLPFWDETGPDSIANGIPWALTAESFVLDGVSIPNPLRSFVLPKNIVDNINGDNPNYSKAKGYETVRYPLSGLVGTPDDRTATAAHNAQFPDPVQNVQILNDNIKNWLGSYVVVQGKVVPSNTAQKYRDCLDAPNYTVFSNTSSAQQWNFDLPAGASPVVSLESPHNQIHLAVGGCEIPGYNRSPIDGANGDMGENDTAGLDPIFFFHHCFVDRVFWLWQKRHGATRALELIDAYPGTNSVDAQGPTPGVGANTWLTLESPLTPFKLDDQGVERDYTSNDCVHIEEQLGYTYGPGSLEDVPPVAALAARAREDVPVLHVSAVNRARIRGSFLISAFGEVDGKVQHLGTEAILSRWSVQGCANCQTHLEVRAAFPLHGIPRAGLPQAKVGILVHGRDGVFFDSSPRPAPSTGLLAAGSVRAPAKDLIRPRVEVR